MRRDEELGRRTPTPVAIVTGAAELVRHYTTGLRRSGDEVVAVGLGDTGRGLATLEPVLGYRAPGCRACSTYLDLVWLLPMLLERADPPSGVVITCHDRDVLVVLRTLIAEPDLEELVEITSVLALLDATQLSVRQATGTLDDDRALAERVAVADSIVLCDTSKITEAAARRLSAELWAMSGIGVVHSEHARREYSALDLTQRHWHGPPPLLRDRPIVTAEQHPDQFRLTRWVGTLSGRVSAELFDAWLGDVVVANAERLVRVQGAIATDEDDTTVYIRGTLSAVNSHPAGPALERSTVAVIGFDLDTSELLTRFHATAATE